MSSQVYPVLPGISFSVDKTPMWNTMRKQTPSGRSYRGTFQTTPRWQYKLSYEFLRDTVAFPELKTLASFYNLMYGGYDTFLFTDPDDNAVVAQTIGTGNASNKVFQLVRTMGSFTEPVYDVNGTPSIYLNGVLQSSGYTISSTGVVTFTAAPGSGVAVTWTGSYYWRCAFDDDTLTLSKFMTQLWEAKTVKFTTVKP
jgi:uncharacterized protein (TIGR02217 family)